MIRRKKYHTRSDGVQLYLTYSDKEFMIKQKETGNLYDQAIDVENAPFSYEETDIPINKEEEESEE